MEYWRGGGVGKPGWGQVPVVMPPVRMMMQQPPSFIPRYMPSYAKGNMGKPQYWSFVPPEISEEELYDLEDYEKMGSWSDSKGKAMQDIMTRKPEWRPNGR